MLMRRLQIIKPLPRTVDPPQAILPEVSNYVLSCLGPLYIAYEDKHENQNGTVSLHQR